MKQSRILIRYGEIGLKAEATRRRFLQVLRNNILYACSLENIPVTIVMKRGRFFLDTEHIKGTTEVLKKIFGIVSFSPVWTSSSELSVLTTDVITVLSSYLDSKTSFALRVRRSGTHEYTSQDAAIHIGQAVCDHFQSPVDLEHPTVELFIEIRDENAFLFVENIAGVGGLPYKTQGTVCCYVQTLDDILASFFLMKRGCAIHFVSTTKGKVEQINIFLKEWYVKQSITFIESMKEKNMCQLLREESKNHECDALCTGLTLIGDKKKTIMEIKNYQKELCLPVLTPLISMTKTQHQKAIEQVGLQT